MAEAAFRMLDLMQVLSSLPSSRWLAALLAICFFASGTLVAIHLHKETRDCTVCVVSHSPAALVSAVIPEPPEHAVLAEVVADPVARTIDLTRVHVIRPPPVVA